MQNHNGAHASSDHHLLEAQLAALTGGIRKLIDRARTTETGEPTRLGAYASKATGAVMAHPFAAVGIALCLGFVSARIARRYGS